MTSLSKNVHEYEVTPNSFEYQYYAIKTIINGESSLMSNIIEVVLPVTLFYYTSVPFLWLPYESGASYKIYKYETSDNIDLWHFDTSLLSLVDTVSNLEYVSEVCKCRYEVSVPDKNHYYACVLVIGSKETIMSNVVKIEPSN